MKPQITIEDLAKLDLRVGEVTDVADVTDSQKLLKLTVDFGPTSPFGLRGVNIYSGIKKWYPPEKLIGRKFIFVVNLAPRTFKVGNQELVSEGMILAAGTDEAVLYNFDKDIKNGTAIH